MIDWNSPHVSSSSRNSMGLRNPVDWDSARWGQDGHNVHYSDNGSDVQDKHGDVS